MENQEHQNDVFFSDEERQALYKTIFSRRDVRGQFKPDPIPDDVPEQGFICIAPCSISWIYAALELCRCYVKRSKAKGPQWLS